MRNNFFQNHPEQRQAPQGRRQSERLRERGEQEPQEVADVCCEKWYQTMYCGPCGTIGIHTYTHAHTRSSPQHLCSEAAFLQHFPTSSVEMLVSMSVSHSDVMTVAWSSSLNIDDAVPLAANVLTRWPHPPCVSIVELDNICFNILLSHRWAVEVCVTNFTRLRVDTSISVCATASHSLNQPSMWTP